MLTLRKKRKNRKGTWSAVRVISNILNTETIPTIFGKEKGRDRGNEEKNLYTEYKFVRLNTVGRSRERERETRWKFNRRRGERKRKKKIEIQNLLHIEYIGIRQIRSKLFRRPREFWVSNFCHVFYQHGRTRFYPPPLPSPLQDSFGSINFLTSHFRTIGGKKDL